MPEDTSTLSTLLSLINRNPAIQNGVNIGAVAPTPPINPNAPPPVDYAALLNAIIPQQQAPVAQKEHPIKTILSALQQAVAVGTSPNPAGAALQQIQNQQAIKLQEQEYQRNRADKLNDIRLQFGLGALRDQMQEQADIRKEGRQQGYREKERKAEEEAAIRAFNREMTGDEIKDKWRFENQKRLMEMNQKYESERQDKKEAQDLLERKFSLKVNLTRELGSPGLASRIIDKWFKNEPLTPAEEKAWTVAAQRNLRLAARGSGGGSGIGSLSERQAFALMQEAMKADYAQLNDITNPDGTVIPGPIVEINAVPKDFMGRPLGLKRQLSKEEGISYAAQRLAPRIVEAVGSMRGKPVPKAVGQAEPGLNQKSEHYRGTFRRLVADGATPEDAAKALTEFSTKNPQDKVVIEGVLIQELKALKKK